MSGWRNAREDRQASDRTYKDPEYQRNRAYAVRRAAGACEKCGRRDRRLQCDHIIPRAQGGSNDEANLQMLCSGPGSCHAAKTAHQPKSGMAPDPPCEARTAW